MDNWPAYARLCGSRFGRPVTHSSYTTTRDVTPCHWDRVPSASEKRETYAGSSWEREQPAHRSVPNRHSPALGGMLRASTPTFGRWQFERISRIVALSLSGRS